MAYDQYSGAISKQSVGAGTGKAGMVGAGASLYVLKTNTTDIGGDDSVGTTTNTFTGPHIEMGRVDIGGNKVLVKVKTQSAGTVTGHAAATATFTFDGAAKTDFASIALVDADGLSKTYYGRGGHGVAATATIVGTAALDDEDGTDFILRNADGSTVTFHTDPTKNFGDTSSDGGDHTWEVNTRDISGGSEVRKATQALYIACKTAIDAGELDMTIDPTTVDPIASGQEEFTLTQTTTGTAGNTAITLVTGVTANGETAFTGGVVATHARSLRSDEFFIEDSATTTGDNFIAIVNGADGHNGTITAANSSGAITLTQATLGFKGNTTITDDANFAAACTGAAPPAAFTGGRDCDLFCEFSPTGAASQWTKYTAVAADVSTNNTGISIANNIVFTDTAADAALVYELDLTAVKAPYIRLGINSQGLALQQSFDIILGIAYPLEYKRSIDKETWNEKGEREG